MRADEKQKEDEEGEEGEGMRPERGAGDKPLSLVVGFQQKPAEKAEVNEIREQKWQSASGWRAEGGAEG